MTENERLIISNTIFDFLEKNVNKIIESTEPENYLKINSLTYVLDNSNINGIPIKELLMDEAGINEKQFKIVRDFFEKEEKEENENLFDSASAEKRVEMLEYQQEMVKHFSIEFSKKALIIFNGIIKSNSLSKTAIISVSGRPPEFFQFVPAEDKFFIGLKSGDAYMFITAIEKLLAFGGVLMIREEKGDIDQIYSLKFSDGFVCAVPPDQLKMSYLFDFKTGEPLPEVDDEEYIYPDFKDDLDNNIS